MGVRITQATRRVPRTVDRVVITLTPNQASRLAGILRSTECTGIGSLGENSSLLSQLRAAGVVAAPSSNFEGAAQYILDASSDAHQRRAARVQT